MLQKVKKMQKVKVLDGEGSGGTGRGSGYNSNNRSFDAELAWLRNRLHILSVSFSRLPRRRHKLIANSVHLTFKMVYLLCNFGTVS